MLETYNQLGLRVMESELVPPTAPKVQLNPELNLSKKFRTEYNAWLRERFGEEPVVYAMNTHALLGSFTQEADLLGSSVLSRPTHIVGNTLTINKLEEAWRKLNET